MAAGACSAAEAGERRADSDRAPQDLQRVGRGGGAAAVDIADARVAERELHRGAQREQRVGNGWRRSRAVCRLAAGHCFAVGSAVLALEEGRIAVVAVFFAERLAVVVVWVWFGWF